MALIKLGVSPSRLSTRGYGEGHPVAGNDSASGRQLNRRVEIVLSDDSGQTPRAEGSAGPGGGRAQPLAASSLNTCCAILKESSPAGAPQ